MNIIYCFDYNYFDITLNSAKSVLKHNKNTKFYFFVNYELPKDQLNQINELKNIKFIKFDESELAEFHDGLLGYTHVSKACFIRLLIPKYLPKLQRALYLDGDTICKGNLEEFYNSDFENNYIIGVQGMDYAKVQARELGIDYYINSGVLLFNIPLMNKERYFNQIKRSWRYSIGLPRIYSADETIINFVFHNKIKLISEKYNYCYNRRYKGREIAPKDVVIWHVTGNNKEYLNLLC